jgi:RHS repeat-associated protein
MNRLIRSLCVLTLCSSSLGMAQTFGTGLYAFGSFESRGLDSINLGNLNAHMVIPIFHKAGRGVPLDYDLTYDSLVWQPVSALGVPGWTPVQNFGWLAQTVVMTGYVSYRTHNYVCDWPLPKHGNYIIYDTWVYHDASGAAHSFIGQLEYDPTGCDTTTTSFTSQSSDGSGLTLNASGIAGPSLTQSITTRNGQTMMVPITAAAESIGSYITDSNGNQISVSSAGIYKDTLGTSALTVSGIGSAASPLSLTYPVALQSNSATTATATVYYKTYTVQTAFLCTGISEYGPVSVDLVDHITLPDASASTYSFTYEATPGVPGKVTGRLASVTLPTGGPISYTYSQGGCNGTSGINADGTVGKLTRTTGDGSRSYTRATVNTNSTSTTVEDEKTNYSVYQFTIYGNLFYETHRQIYQGAVGGAPLMEQFTCYNGVQPSCDGSLIALPINETRTVTSYNGGTQVGVNNTYDPLGMLTSSQYYTSATLQTTTNSYNTLEELMSSTTTDGSGNVLTSSTYGYDETSPAGTSGIPQHTSAPGARRNQTSIHVSTGSGTLTTKTVYYDTGAPLTVTTPNGTTSYGYDSTQTFATTTTLPTPSSGVALAMAASYDPLSGVQLSATGVNAGQTVGVTVYDPLLRPLAALLPNGGEVVTSYSPTQIGSYQTMSSTESTNTQTLLDSYGRTSRVAVNNGQSSNPWYQVDYCYDVTGNLQFQSVRYQGNGWATPKECSGSGTSYVYDALGRVTNSTNADGTTSTLYTGRAEQTTDVNGVKRITQYDLLGRISGICEIVSYSSVIGSGSPAACGMDIAGTGYLTSYTYTGLTTTIAQGAQARVFTTDQAGRPTTIIEPERGQTSYSYAYNSTGLVITRTRPQANQNSPSALTTTTTQYDSLGRAVTVTYNDGITANKSFWYDQNPFLSWSSQATTNLKGNLGVTATGLSVMLTSDLFSYDALGHVTTVWQCAPSICNTSSQASRPGISLTYDLAGNLTSEGDGASGIIAYGRSPAGEVTSITNQSYTNQPYNPPNLVSNVVNGPNGPSLFSLGNGLTGVRSYDSMGRLNGGWICKGSSGASCGGGTQIYGFTAGWRGSQMIGSCDTVLTVCSSFGYDQFNRLATSTVTSGTPQNFSYNIDRYGNRWQQNVTAGSGPSPSVAFNTANNQITTAGYAYDAAGNMTSDGFHTYTYDAEGNILNVDNGSTAQYVYDAMNRRVRVQTASSTNEYLFDYAGRRTSTWQVSNNAGDEGRIYWDGVQIAFRSIDGTTYFDHQNWLGTERLRTNYAGSVASSYVSLPFGDGYTPNIVTSSGDQDNLHFAELDHDSESTTEHAQFRQYSSTQGHWMSPDLYDGSYRARNPQSFNRYVYAMNRPLSATDPSGLDPAGSDGGGDGQTCIANCDQSDPNPTDGSSGNDGSVSGSGSGSTSSTGRRCFVHCGQRAPINCHTLAEGQVPDSSASTWWAGVTHASTMFRNFLAGTGAQNGSYGPGSVQSQQMMSAYNLSANVAQFLAGGKASGFQNFGGRGVLASGLNPTAQFVGSYGWSMSLNNRNLNISISNATTPFSFFYHASIFSPNPPNRPESGWYPLGRVNQSIYIQVPCS